MDPTPTIIILVMIFANILITYSKKGYAFSALISILNISIATDAFFTSTYATIYFTPWVPLLLLMVAIVCMVDGIRKNK